jgi:hypothetical protein
MAKAKFCKSKCLKCKYHSTGIGYSVDDKGKKRLVHCGYSLVTGLTCLRVNGNGKIKDIRGSQYMDCKCFEEGIAVLEVNENDNS